MPKPCFVVDTIVGTVLSFQSRARAGGIAGLSPERIVVDNEAGLPLGTMNLLLMKIGHPLAGGFTQRQDALPHLEGVLARLAMPGERPATPRGRAELLSINPEITRRSTKMAAKKTAAKRTRAKAAKKAGVRQGKFGQFTGKKIVKIEKSNPRKEGTSGHNSWKAIPADGSYEKYLANGGVRRDLEWCLARGWCKLAPA
jgi:hypothetical protein